jgi:uncharacterized protein with PQ loop repeat
MLVVPYILVTNVYFIPAECTIFKVLAQHVSNVTASIIRSATIVYFKFSDIGFVFWCVYSVHLVMVFGHMVTLPRSVLDPYPLLYAKLKKVFSETNVFRNINTLLRNSYC